MRTALNHQRPYNLKKSRRHRLKNQPQLPTPLPTPRKPRTLKGADLFSGIPDRPEPAA